MIGFISSVKKQQVDAEFGPDDLAAHTMASGNDLLLALLPDLPGFVRYISPFVICSGGRTDGLVGWSVVYGDAIAIRSYIGT